MGDLAGDLAAQVRWLVDRAQISDLLVEFARTLDERDWAANTALYVPEGVFMAGDALRLQGHAELQRTGTPQGLGRYRGTWHLSANHAIDIDGDTARTRSYLLGVHLLDENTFRHADGAGWYHCTLRRTAEGWRFVTVRVRECGMQARLYRTSRARPLSRKRPDPVVLRPVGHSAPPPRRARPRIFATTRRSPRWSCPAST